MPSPTPIQFNDLPRILSPVHQVMPLVSNGPVFRPRPGAAPRSPLRRLGWRDSAIAGYAGKLDGESRKGNGVVAGVILLADEERLGGKRVANALFLASSHFPTKEPLRTSSVNAPLSGSRFRSGKPLRTFPGSAPPSVVSLASGSTQTEIPAFAGMTLWGHGGATLVTPQRAIMRLPVDPRIRKGPGRCRAPLKLSATKLTGRSCQR